MLNTEVRTFWNLVALIGRLRAEEDQRALQVAAAAQSSEGFNSLRETLQYEAGTPVVVKAKRDPNALNELRAALGGG